MIVFSTLRFLNPAFDLTTLLLIAAILLLSLLSLCFIFHFTIKSRTLPHLQSFNALWTVRFLLVSFISFWAINELLRLSFLRSRYAYGFLPAIPVSLQIDLCKIHVVLSLGFFEPAFLVTLLFLVNVSIKKKTIRDIWAIGVVLLTCIPVLLLQIFVVYFTPMMRHLPPFLRRSYLVVETGDEHDSVLCSYPLSSTIIFAAFGTGYTFSFMYSFYRVVSLVINKGLRLRFYWLALTILISLPTQILFLALSVFWRPDDHVYSGVVLIVFVSTFVRAAAGEGIMIIKPITDSLAAGEDISRWSDDDENSVGEHPR